MRWEFLHLWLLSYVSYPRILHISEQFNWLKFLDYTQGMSEFESQFRYQAKEVQFRQQYVVQVRITLNGRSYALSRRPGRRGPHPEYCEYIWLGSIVANALDCLSSYRGFESHPSRHCGVEKRPSRHPHKVEIVGSNPTSAPM